ncbi:MAG TPA: TonB-dependent receptor [Flavipsychrobacter sp.]|nr:TonB-dependent receptor [Flavipsychrobacter sp.]
MINRVALQIVMLFCFITNAFGQQAVDTLKEVKVHGSRTRNISNSEKLTIFSPGQKIKTIDSTTLQQYQLQSLANLLSQQVPVFIKSYGFNSLATLNFRGSSAAQSEVLWNGVPINNAALGIADVSILPVFLINKVNIVYGSSSALWGSGNVGGALLLENNEPVFDTGIKKTFSISGGIGSYSQYMGGIQTSYSSKRWYFSVNAFLQQSLNNFHYTTSSGAEAQMPNSRLQGVGGIFQSAYQIDKHNVINLFAWYQQYYREIPPALFETASVKNQKDGSLRFLLSWNKEKFKNNWYAKSSFIRDFMHYQDSSVLLNSENITYQYYQEVGWKRKIGDDGQLLVFAPLQISWINLQSLNETKQQIKSALAAAYEIHLFHSKLNIAVNAREENINDNNVFLPGVNAAYTLTEWLSLRGNIQRTYRAPTLDELYYVPGGNPDLRSEHGWNEDAGYTIRLPIGDKLFLYHDLSVFNRDIKNWIIWFGGAIWTPHNIAVVNSRGIETENSLQWQSGKWKLHLGVNTSYVLATTQSSYIVNDGSIGKQIPYTPRYSGQLNVGFSFSNLLFNYNHTYTGYRFITTDESEYLDPYQTGNLQLQYNCYIAHHNVQIIAQCNNVWNQHYEVVAFRPMPGINWLIGLKFNLLQ